jgi:hypothetical protein
MITGGSNLTPFCTVRKTTISIELDNMAVEAIIHFLARDPLYRSEKPYSLRFTPESIPQTNLKPVKRTVKVRDLRDDATAEKLDFESCGFGVVSMESALAYDDFFKSDMVKSVYYIEIGQMLKTLFKANYIYVLDHGVC